MRKGVASAANAGAGESGLRFGLFTPTEMPKLPLKPIADAEPFRRQPCFAVGVDGGGAKGLA